MKNKILIIFLGLIGVFLSAKIAYAGEYDSNLKIKLIDNITGYKYKNGVLMSRSRIPFRYQNNELVYCIEPNNHLGSYLYNSTYDFSISGLDSETKRQMELISHYGYGYKNHNSVNYYLATQELIWLYIDDYVKWMSEYSIDGTVGTIINVEKEKEEILNLIRKHDILPNFEKKTYSAYFGTDIIITDKNNILDNYDIITDLDYELNGSSITFHANKFGTHGVKFKTKYLENDSTKLYYTYDSSEQKMAKFGLSDIKELDIAIKVDKVKVKINKKDVESKKVINNAKTIFEIINKDTGRIEEVEVNGTKTIYLAEGIYDIREITAPTGYILDNKVSTFEINNNVILENNYFILDRYNKKAKGNINVIKKDEYGNSLYGVEIGLYDHNHKFIRSLITNENSSFENLDLGEYYIKELSTLYGYQLDPSEYKINLDYVDGKADIINKDIEIINKKIKCSVTYISQSNIKLRDVQINVYDENDKLVFSGSTSENGQVVIENLPYGKYYIKQIKVPKGYTLNEEKYIFYVNDSTCSSVIKVHNDKTIMPITTSKLDLLLSLSLVLFILGIYNYVKKNN